MSEGPHKLLPQIVQSFCTNTVITLPRPIQESATFHSWNNHTAPNYLIRTNASVIYSACVSRWPLISFFDNCTVSTAVTSAREEISYYTTNTLQPLFPYSFYVQVKYVGKHRPYSTRTIYNYCKKYKRIASHLLSYRFPHWLYLNFLLQNGFYSKFLWQYWQKIHTVSTWATFGVFLTPSFIGIFVICIVYLLL